MNQELFLLKMGEIVLKGLNRRRFEERLMGNLQRRLHPYGRFRAISRQSKEQHSAPGRHRSGRRMGVHEAAVRHCGAIPCQILREESGRLFSGRLCLSG